MREHWCGREGVKLTGFVHWYTWFLKDPETLPFILTPSANKVTKWDKQRRIWKIDSPLHPSLYSWCSGCLLISLWCHNISLLRAEVRTEVCYSVWPVLQINEKLLRLKRTSAPWEGSHLWRLFSRWRGSSRREVTSKSPLWSFSEGLWGNCLIYATAWIKKLEYDVTVSKKKKRKGEMNFTCPPGFLSLLSVSPFFWGCLHWLLLLHDRL